MPIEKSIKFGLLGIGTMITGSILKFLSIFNVFYNRDILFSFLYLVGPLFLLISLYSLFKYTENSDLGCKINLLGIFSFLLLVIYDIVNFVGHFLPAMSTLFTTLTLFNVATVVSNLLMTLFLFNIYLNKTTDTLNNFRYKLVLASNLVNLIITGMQHVNYILHVNSANTHSSFTIVSSISIIYKLMLLVTYKGFVQELKLISDKTCNNKAYGTT
ncbi:hypothetical protein [Clostridium cylindrosporum]|uniref:Uncharacterized protein n=1 Tax=Clostridium cylindrosporum DSM 605 TaxID=1121307 RepID=A0A0J8D7V1_CLOCY|nr:hypothetical protein [Clostridium cylindrosporum]KMT22120.1 hypothetical protein CLCY_4c00930 [Clostridium cylindrosporum DSM 605]